MEDAKKWEDADSKKKEYGAYYWGRTAKAEFKTIYTKDGKLCPVGEIDENKLMKIDALFETSAKR